MRRIDIAPESEGGRGGGGNDEDPRFRRLSARTHGLIAIAFGFAVGVTIMIFVAAFHYIDSITPPTELQNFVATKANIGWSFLYGFVGGTLISAIYNCLVFRKLNLFGLDRCMD